MLSHYLLEPLGDTAVRHSLAAVLALALGAGPIGVFLMLRRMSLIGDAMSHAILPGVAIGFLVAGLSVEPGHFIARGCIACGISTRIARLRRRDRDRQRHRHRTAHDIPVRRGG